MTVPVIGVDTFSLSRSSAYKELYFPRKILKPEVDVNTYYYYWRCCCCRWWRLLLGLLVLRPSISSLLQSATSVTTKCDSFFYYKVRWSVITKCDSFFITKCDRYYKVRRLLQSATVPRPAHFYKLDVSYAIHHTFSKAILSDRQRKWRDCIFKNWQGVWKWY